MKKLFMFLLLLIPLCAINVSAEEVTITGENSYLLFDKIEESYFENNSIDKNNCYFYTFERGTDGIYIVISSLPFKRAGTYINFDSSVTNLMFLYKFSDSTFDLYSSTFNRSNFNTVFYSNSDILDKDGSLYFAKNYTPDQEPEVTPTPNPPIEDDGNDNQELERCDSFVCNITEDILDDFNVEGFDFIKTILYFALILLFVLLILSPFILIFKLVRWL